MNEQIAHLVQAYWEEHLPALLDTLEGARRDVDTMLASPAVRPETETSTARLRPALGQFGAEAVDTEMLSGFLDQSKAKDGQARLHRLHRLADDLEAVHRRWARTPPQPVLHTPVDRLDEPLRAFDAHVAPVCDGLRLVRQVRLERRGLYVPAQHDQVFAAFDWRQLDTAELGLCPPFVVISEPGPPAGPRLAALLELVTTGRPLKVALLHRAWHPDSSQSGHAAGPRGLDDVTLLFLALRTVFFVQTSVAAPTPMAERLAQGLTSTRPAVFSIFAHGDDPDDVARRGAAALAARAFPHLVYDPDRASAFVACLDLSDNPEPASTWVARPLPFVDQTGGRSELVRPFTCADYAWAEPEWRGHFTALPPDQEGHALPLADYLNLEPRQRRTRVPYVQAVDAEHHLVRLVPSTEMLTFTSDRMHLWTTLLELGGVHNPFVLAAERRVRAELTREKETALREQKAQLEATARAREQVRLTAAMRALVARLTGIGLPAPLNTDDSSDGKAD